MDILSLECENKHCSTFKLRSPLTSTCLSGSRSARFSSSLRLQRSPGSALELHSPFEFTCLSGSARFSSSARLSSSPRLQRSAGSPFELRSPFDFYVSAPRRCLELRAKKFTAHRSSSTFIALRQEKHSQDFEGKVRRFDSTCEDFEAKVRRFDSTCEDFEASHSLSLYLSLSLSPTQLVHHAQYTNRFRGWYNS